MTLKKFNILFTFPITKTGWYWQITTVSQILLLYLNNGLLCTTFPTLKSDQILQHTQEGMEQKILLKPKIKWRILITYLQYACSGLYSGEADLYRQFQHTYLSHLLSMFITHFAGQLYSEGHRVDEAGRLLWGHPVQPLLRQGQLQQVLQVHVQPGLEHLHRWKPQSFWANCSTI